MTAGMRRHSCCEASGRDVRRQQRRQPGRVAAGHAALRVDTVDPDMASCRRKTSRISCIVVVVHEAEISSVRGPSRSVSSGAKNASSVRGFGTGR